MVKVIGAGYLDPYVASVLRDESVTVQRAAIGILRIVKELGKASIQSQPRQRLRAVLNQPVPAETFLAVGLSSECFANQTFAEDR